MRLPLILLLNSLLPTTASAFAFIDHFLLNKNEYKESVEQPWFRVQHSRHTKIPIEEAASSSFGQHNVPSEKVFVAPYWTDEEKKFMHCLDRRCVCGFYNGNNSTALPCLLPDGTQFDRAVRKEIRMLKDADRIAFETVLNKMKKDGTYNRLSRVHKYSGVHSGPAFTVWHRELLKRFELVIRSYEGIPAGMGIPYWDTSLDSLLPEPLDSIMFSSTFLGEVDENDHVVTGPYANWTTMEGPPFITRHLGADPEGEFISPARIDWVASQTDIRMVLAATEPLSTCTELELDERFLEYSHNYVHFLISGDMGKSWSSSNDVIFLLHHSMIDYIFEMFRQNGQDRNSRERDYPPTNPACFPPWHNADAIMPMLSPITNTGGLSNGYTDNMYEFAARPTCDAIKKDCGSRYLYCNAENPLKTFCMSKIRPGGDCRGFDGKAICYDGVCKKGKCQKSKGDGIKLKKESKLSDSVSLMM